MANMYREIFATPGAMGLVIASYIARLPQAMIDIGIITMLVQQTGLYSLAGLVAGTFALANAFVSPQVSKFVDRWGQRRVLPFVTAFSTSMLLALIIAAHMKAPALLLFILAALAGTMPSMPSMIRARWTQLFRGKPQLSTAFSLDTVLTELVFITGAPLAIGLSICFFSEAGPLVAVLLLVIGVTVILLQRKTEPRVVVGISKNESSLLLIPGVRIIVLSLLAMGIVAGTIDVAVVAFANAQDWPASASFILAAYACGSIIAGLTFGAVNISLPMEKQLFAGALVTAVTSLLPVFSPDVYILSGLLFVAGMSFAPTMVVVMGIGSSIISSARVTEGLTWMTTGLSIGAALGSVLSGIAIDIYDARAGFGVASVAGVAMVIVVILGLRILSCNGSQSSSPGLQ